jgi:hypothetical protein
MWPGYSAGVPALRQLAYRPALEAMIRPAVEELFINDRATTRRVGLYLFQSYTELKLKELGVAYVGGRVSGHAGKQAGFAGDEAERICAKVS